MTDLRASSPPNNFPCFIKRTYWSIAAEAFEDERASFFRAKVTTCFHFGLFESELVYIVFGSSAAARKITGSAILIS